MAHSMLDDGKYIPGLTFLAKNEIECPICESKFMQEKLQSGGGRMISGEITELLHRRYLPSQKAGRVYPLIYSIVVCPNCFYATMAQDFMKAPPESIGEIKAKTSERIEFAGKLSDEIIDYSKARTVESGAVSYALAVICYEHFKKKQSPVIKQALCSIRAAFLFEDLELEKPNRYYLYLAELFYKKASFLYKHALDLNIKKEQIIETIGPLGPDTDKDYGFDGIVFLVGLLTYKYGDKTNTELRKRELDEAKISLGRLFGMGKSNFDKPKVILEKSKDYYDIINKELKELEESAG